MSKTTASLTTTVLSSSTDRFRIGSAEAELLPLLTDYLDDVATRTAVRLGDIAGVAITLSVGGQPFTVGASNALARDVDLIQYRIGSGPCLHALRHGIGLYVTDLAGDDRWGDYGIQAAARGAASCVSVPVIVGHRPAAVLKVYARDVDGLSRDQQALAKAAAIEVAGGVGLAGHLSRQSRQLDDRAAAMTSRRVIDLAIGVLMERMHTDADTAFLVLRSISQTQNVKLRDAARDLVGAASDETVAHAPFNERGGKPAPGR